MVFMNINSLNRDPPILKIPSISSQKVIKIIKKLGQDPIGEICTRVFAWNSNSNIRFVIGIKDHMETLCAVTSAGIMKALFGSAYKELCEKNRLANFDRINIDKNKEGLLLEKSSFCAYEVGIIPSKFYTPKGEELFGGHTFVIIQYVNEDNKIRYQIFQSYIKHYALKEEHGEANNLSEAQFQNFVEFLITFGNSSKLTQEMKERYKQYFFVDLPYPVNSSYASLSSSLITFGRSRVEGVLELKHIFNIVKLSPEFPRCITLPSREAYAELKHFAERREPFNSYFMDARNPSPEMLYLDPAIIEAKML